MADQFSLLFTRVATATIKTAQAVARSREAIDRSRELLRQFSGNLFVSGSAQSELTARATRPDPMAQRTSAEADRSGDGSLHGDHG